MTLGFRKWYQKLILPSLAGFALVALTACGGSATTAPAQPTATATTAPQPTATPTQTPAQKPVIKLDDNQFQSLWVNEAVFQFIAEHGYGYKVERENVSTAIAEQAIATGDANVWLEMWQQNWIDKYNQLVSEGKLENLGHIYGGGPQFWVVPTYFAKKYNIKTLDDMKKPEVVKALKNPEDPSKGAFINCPTAWQCGAINKAKIRAYGLDKYYDVVEPGSGAALKATLVGAQKEKRPVFGYYWKPTSLMAQYNWTILQEPKYSAACWKEVAKGQNDQSYTPKEACAYQTLPVDIGVNSAFAKKAPDIVAFLKKMDVGVDPIDQTAAWADNNNVDTQKDWQKIAVYYLNHFESRWTQWIPSDIAQKVKDAAAGMSS